MPSSLPIVIDDGTENLKLLAGGAPVALSPDQARYTVDDIRRMITAARGGSSEARTALRSWLSAIQSELQVAATWLDGRARRATPGAISGAYTLDDAGARRIGVQRASPDAGVRAPSPAEAAALAKVVRAKAEAIDKLRASLDGAKG